MLKIDMNKELKNLLKTDVEIPQIVTDKMDEAFGRIKKSEGSIDRSLKRRRAGKIRIALIAAVVMLFCGMTVFAAVIKWNSQMALKFEADEEKQIELLEIGVAKNIDMFAENNGITISAETALFDSNFMYLYFKITAPEITFTPSFSFANFELLTDGEPIPANYVAGVPELSEDGMDHTTYWEIWVDTGGVDFRNSVLTVQFEDLCELDKTGAVSEELVKGNWDLEFPITYSDATENFLVNEHIPDANLMVKEITISPISIQVIYDFPRVEKTEEAYTDTGEVTSYQYYEEPVFVSAFRLQDGTVVPAEITGPGHQGYLEMDNDVYAIVRGFGRIYTVSDIKSVIFGDNLFEIKL